MALQSLFDRSPVLPVDVSISLARYLHSVRATHKQALASERSDDLKRAGLLHIRVLQLVCKTLPTHPDYSLPENVHVVRKLRAIAHTAFRDIDRVAAALTPKPSLARALPSPPEPGTFALEVAGALVDLFERVATENTWRAVSTTGILAGPGFVENEGDDGPVAFPLRVTALIIPSQSSSSTWSNIRYEEDVDQLLSIKKLRAMGLIAVAPLEDSPILPSESKQGLSTVQKRFEHGFALIVAGRSAENDARDRRAATYRLSQAEPTDDAEDEFEHVEGERVSDVQIREDGHPAFKLYDLRPLAAARDGQMPDAPGRASLRST